MIREELLAIMDQAAREGWTELDLRDKKIVELPGEIGQLTRLQKLFIGDRKFEVSGLNTLTKLPTEIGQLAYLQELKLNCGNLTAIPLEGSG